jgi:DNA polymerase-3 subunit delta'
MTADVEEDTGRRASDDPSLEPQPIEFLPWHAQARDRIGAALASGRLPHGLLVQGAAGIGKEQFSSAFAAALICTRRGERFEACRECDDCRLSLAGTHPDVHWVRRLWDPEKKKLKNTIGVDQIREVCERLAMTSMRRGYRVGIVSPADLMTTQAQNSLLKTLEEPSPRTILVLVAARPASLLATLRSRCQRVEIARPAPGLALDWLNESLGREASPRLLSLAGGAPIKALALAPHFEELERQMAGVLEAYLGGRIEVTRAAADMLGEGLPVRLDWMEAWLGGALRRRTGAGDEKALTFPGAALLQRPSVELNITAAFQVLDRLREARRLLEGSVAPQLVVESLLLDLRSALRPRR